MIFKTITNKNTGSQFIVFAEGAGLRFGVRAWAMHAGGEGGDKPPVSLLALRFRVERAEDDDTSDVSKVVEHLFPDVLWGNGDKSYRSAMAQLTIAGMVNGKVLISYLQSQGVVDVLYRAWEKTISGHPGLKMVLSMTEFFSAIVTTMEGTVSDHTQVSATTPFKKAFFDLVLAEANDDVQVDSGTMKQIGLQ